MTDWEMPKDVPGYIKRFIYILEGREGLIGVQRKRITELEARLKIEGDHPFPDGYDAIDLANDRIKILEAEVERLKGEASDYKSYLEMYFPGEQQRFEKWGTKGGAR